MAGKITLMSTVKQVLLKHQHGDSIRSIARHLSISRNTVKSYLAKVETLGIGIDALLALDDMQLESRFHVGNPAYSDLRHDTLMDRMDQTDRKLNRIEDLVLELKQLIKGAKTIFLSKKGKKKALKEEKKTIAFAFASVTTVKDIKKNEKLTEKNIFTLRPANGFYKVADYKKLLGKKAKVDIKKGVQLTNRMILN